MTQLDDYVGRTLGDLKAKCASEGIIISRIAITSEPRIQIQYAEDDFRILRIDKEDDNSINVLLCKPH